MKKILILIMLFPVLLSSQYSKKEIKQKEKWIEKLQLRVVNRGVDINKTFVFFVDKDLSESTGEKIAEIAFGGGDDENWDYIISEFENAMFLNGLDVGSYSFNEIEKGSKNNALVEGNLNVNGDYLFEFDRSGGDYRKIFIKDVDNKFKVVATILFRNKLSRIGGITGTYALTKRILIEHILEEFIKSCK